MWNTVSFIFIGKLTNKHGFDHFPITNTLPESLKVAEIISIYKKDKPENKHHDILISMVSNNSQVYDRHIHSDMGKYFHYILLKFW